MTATIARFGIAASFRTEKPGFSFAVDLTLPARGVTVIFGPSGCGKTTLLRCIAGLERVPQGELSIEGEVWQDKDRWVPPHKRALGYVFQEASLFSHLSVRGNLDFGRRRSPHKTELHQAIQLLDLERLLDRKTAHLSGGEKQRVSIARALAAAPRLLLMDEPLASLDHERKQEILPYLERLHKELEIPLLYVTHAPDEVARLADHIVVLSEGRVAMSGPLQETLTRLDLPLRLGHDRGSVIEGTITLTEAEWNLVRVDFDGGCLWTADQGIALGTRVRIGIHARDVSLALDKPESSSIQNLLPGEVDALGDDEHPSQLLVRVKVGKTSILASLTRRAAANLQIRTGMPLWVQIKSVALIK